MKGTLCSYCIIGISKPVYKSKYLFFISTELSLFIQNKIPAFIQLYKVTGSGSIYRHLIISHLVNDPAVLKIRYFLKQSNTLLHFLRQWQILIALIFRQIHLRIAVFQRILYQQACLLPIQKSFSFIHKNITFFCFPDQDFAVCL